MTRNATRLVALLAVLGLVAVPAAAATTGGFGATGADRVDESGAAEDAEVLPGERLSGVVGVHGAEVDGEVEERTYGVKIARAATDEAKADVVAEQFDEVERRLDEHERREADLERRREAGEITEGQYRAKVAELSARTQTTRRMADASERTAVELPEETLSERGVTVEDIGILKERADELDGPGVREIATSIAGEDVGQPMAGAGEIPDIADRIPDDRGPGGGTPTPGPD